MKNLKEQYVKQNNFNREHYDHFNLMLPKGKKDLLKSLATLKDISVNALVNEAINEYLKLHNNE